MTWLSVPTLAK